jgi:hypothetical protein
MEMPLDIYKEKEARKQREVDDVEAQILGQGPNVQMDIKHGGKS